MLRRHTLRDAAERVAALEQNTQLKPKTARFGGPPKPPKPPDIWPCAICGGAKLPSQLSLTDPIHGPVTLNTLDGSIWSADRLIAGNFGADANQSFCAPDGTTRTTRIQYKYRCNNGALTLAVFTCTTPPIGGSNYVVGIQVGYLGAPPSDYISMGGTGTCTPFNRSFSLDMNSFPVTNHVLEQLYGARQILNFTLTKPA